MTRPNSHDSRHSPYPGLGKVVGNPASHRAAGSPGRTSHPFVVFAPSQRGAKNHERVRRTHGPGGPPWGGENRRPTGISCTTRSEEHTSELQSLRHLVCRLLLEKKKQNN